MGKASKCTICEVEEIVDEIPADQVHLPSIYVKRLLIGDKYEKRIEVRPACERGRKRRRGSGHGAGGGGGNGGAASHEFINQCPTDVKTSDFC